MNILPVFAAIAAGFSVSFIAYDVVRLIGRPVWFANQGVIAPNRFALLPVCLALIAGPSLFVAAMLRLARRRTLGLWDGCASVAIAIVWALCYGIVVLECAARSGLFRTL